MTALNCQDDAPSNPIDNFKDKHVLVFQLPSIQDGTEKSHYRELVGEPLRLELTLILPLGQVTKLIGLEERMLVVAVATLALLERISQMDNVVLQQKTNCILPLNHR